MNLIKNEQGKKSLSEQQISFSHAVTRSAHGLALVEKRILALFLGKFDTRSHKRLMDRVISLEDSTIKITAQEYSETFDVDIKTSYRDLVKSCDNLLNKTWRVIQDTPKGKKEFANNWLSGVVYHHGEGWIEASFTTQTIPHLVFSLRDSYTKYKLKSTMALRSAYSWRLWELLAQFADPSEKHKKRNEERVVRITLDEFRYAMEAPESYKFSQIRQKIIEPAIEEISRENQIGVTYRAIKKGRSVYSLEFTYKPAEQLDLFGGKPEELNNESNG